MSELLLGIAAQPNFPHEDVSDDNAAILELLLSNLEIVDKSHRFSERNSWIFTVGHRMIATVAGNILEHNRQIEALNHGTTVFEAMSAMLVAEPARPEFFTVQTQAVTWINADPHQIDAYQQEATANFHTDLPNAEAVVERTAKRFYPYLTNCAVIGAAMARQFELDTTTI